MSILGDVISVKVCEYGYRGQDQVWVSEDAAQHMCNLAMGNLYGVIHDGKSLTHVDIVNASHVVANAELKDGWVTADIAALDTPQGRILHTLIESGATVEGEVVMTGVADPYTFEITELEDARFDVTVKQAVTNTIKDSILSIF